MIYTTVQQNRFTHLEDLKKTMPSQKVIFVLKYLTMIPSILPNLWKTYINSENVNVPKSHLFLFKLLKLKLKAKQTYKHA